MTLQDLGAIGEFVGSLGVIVTLVYLAIQIRQNTSAQRNNSRLETTRAFTDWYSIGMTDPEILRVWNRALVDRADLTDEEQSRLAWMMSALASRIEEMYTQCQGGLIDESLYARYRGAMRAFLEVPAVRQWWDSGATVFSVEFRNDVENTALEDSTLEVLNVDVAVKGRAKESGSAGDNAK